MVDRGSDDADERGAECKTTKKGFFMSGSVTWSAPHLPRRDRLASNADDEQTHR